MATVYDFLPSMSEYYELLQNRTDAAENRRFIRFKAAMTILRFCRGCLIRRHKAWCASNVLIIQCAYKRHKTLTFYRAALKRAVRSMHEKHYGRAAIVVQATWRGHHSRRVNFCYRTYRQWLATVTERGEKRAAEAAEFGIKSRADDIKILEEESRQWIAFLVFKLHHLLRTYNCAGIYSEPASTELTDFEKLLQSIHYTEYMKRLKRKYDEFVRKHRPAFSNKRLFPIIGDGAEYWYLSLPEMYQLTSPAPKKEDYRHKATHHSQLHKEPFLWKKVKPPAFELSRGPFNSPIHTKVRTRPNPRTPWSTPQISLKQRSTEDPRFQLYVKHYKPEPALFEYVDFHVNILLKHKCSVTGLE